MLQGSKVLITGVTGQIAASVAAALAPKCDMWALARFTRPGSREESEAMGLRTVVGDFATGDFSDLPQDFDYVLHFAANTKPGSTNNGILQNAEGTGLLMHHCRSAKAFVFVSTTGVYKMHPDPQHLYHEDDDLGGLTEMSPNYGLTKVAAEGVVRTLARIYNMPCIIARMNVAYGDPFDDGGLPGIMLRRLLAGETIQLPPSGMYHSPIHEDDLVSHIEPFLKAASVPATIVNWGGDTPLNTIDWLNYLGEITGHTPKIEFTDDRRIPNGATDTTKGREIGLTWTVPWKEGMRRMVQARCPDIELLEPAGD
jgi:nucleoside-diphosphate-sugar epimerase